MSDPVTPVSPSKRRVFFTRLSSTLVLWSLLAFAFISQNDAFIISVISLFGLLTGIEFFRLTRDPEYPRQLLFKMQHGPDRRLLRVQMIQPPPQKVI